RCARLNRAGAEGRSRRCLPDGPILAGVSPDPLMSNKTGVTTRCRLLCPVCGDIQRVIAVNGKVDLACGHVRGELLPKYVGHLSIEELASRSAKDQKLAHSLFPARRSNESTALP